MKMYCVRCKKKVEALELTKTKTKKGRPMMRGVCPDCDCKLCSFKIEQVDKNEN